MAGETFDLGNIYRNVEAIKGMQRQSATDALQQKYLGIQTEAATQQLQQNKTNAAQTQQAMQSKRVYAGSQAILNDSQDPKGTAEALFPDFVKDFDTQHGQGAWAQISPDQVKQLAAHLRDKAGMDLGQAAPAKHQVIGDLNNPTNGVYDIEPETGTPKQVTAPQKPEQATAPTAIIGPDGKPVYVSHKDAVGKTPFNATTNPTTSFGQSEGELLAALTERGVSLPAGFRSKEQQVQTLRSLYAKNPGLNADQIADKIKSGKINLSSETKFANTAAAQGGRIETAINEMHDSIPYALELSARVPRGSFVPWNKLKQYSDQQLSDPNLIALKGALQTIANQYDVVAGRGGTDMAKRAHNRELFDSANSPEALTAVLNVMQREASIAKRAAANAAKGPARDDSQTPQTQPAMTPGQVFKHASGATVEIVQ